MKYDIHANFDIRNKAISGYCAIQYKVVKPGKIMQIDLQAPMQIDSCVFISATTKKTYFTLDNKTKTDAHFINSPEGQEINRIYPTSLLYTENQKYLLMHLGMAA